MKKLVWFIVPVSILTIALLILVFINQNNATTLANCLEKSNTTSTAYINEDGVLMPAYYLSGGVSFDKIYNLSEHIWQSNNKYSLMSGYTVTFTETDGDGFTETGTKVWDNVESTITVNSIDTSIYDDFPDEACTKNYKINKDGTTTLPGYSCGTGDLPTFQLIKEGQFQIENITPMLSLIASGAVETELTNFTIADGDNYIRFTFTISERKDVTSNIFFEKASADMLGLITPGTYTYAFDFNGRLIEATTPFGYGTAEYKITYNE